MNEVFALSVRLHFHVPPVLLGWASEHPALPFQNGITMKARYMSIAWCYLRVKAYMIRGLPSIANSAVLLNLIFRVCVCRYVAATSKFCNDLLEEVEATSATKGREVSDVIAADGSSGAK